MPKSEFEPVVAIVDGSMQVAGPLTADTADAPGDAPSRVVWMIDQDGRAMPGISPSIDPGAAAWAATAPARPDWVDGDAQASGLLVTPTADGARTFAWTQRVELRVQGGSAT